MVKIIVFDSGFGSLSIIKQIRKKMSAEVIYFADQANYPYGKKSNIQLQKIVKNTIKFLKKEFKPDLIIIGSNTPSILLKEFNSSKIIGVYPPLKEASKRTHSSIAILATQNVVQSKKLDELIRKNTYKNVKVLKINASPLVDLVESGKFIKQKQFCRNKIKSLLKNTFENSQVDVVTLSSTHLPFLLPMLKQTFPKILFLDPAEEIANKIMKKYRPKKSGKSRLSIYSSGKTEFFQAQLSQIGIRRKVKYLKIH